jgi:hypothetical protein
MSRAPIREANHASSFPFDYGRPTLASTDKHRFTQIIRTQHEVGRISAQGLPKMGDVQAVPSRKSCQASVFICVYLWLHLSLAIAGP